MHLLSERAVFGRGREEQGLRQGRPDDSVGTDGKVDSLYTLRGLPDGLTEAAIAAVRNWRFKAAADPSGKPTVVRNAIDVVFHLY